MSEKKQAVPAFLTAKTQILEYKSFSILLPFRERKDT